PPWRSFLDRMDSSGCICFTLAMPARLPKALLAIFLALSFILNGSVMQAAHAHKPVPSSAIYAAHDAMPCHHAHDTQPSHPCCPSHSPDKATCTSDCCTSVVPVTLLPGTQFTYVIYKPRPHPMLAPASLVAEPPSRPPKI